MKTWHDNCIIQIYMSKGLAYTLSFGQGMKNIILLLVECNQSKLNGLKLLCEK